MARGRVRLLVITVVCFQQRREIRVSLRLLPPGKLSVAVGVVWRRDAEDSDAQVGGDLEAHTRTVPRQINKREDHGDPEDYVFVDEAVEVLVEDQ